MSERLYIPRTSQSSLLNYSTMAFSMLTAFVSLLAIIKASNGAK